MSDLPEVWVGGERLDGVVEIRCVAAPVDIAGPETWYFQTERKYPNGALESRLYVATSRVERDGDRLVMSSVALEPTDFTEPKMTMGPYRSIPCGCVEYVGDIDAHYWTPCDRHRAEIAQAHHDASDVDDTFAWEMLREHDPVNQASGYDRCAVCNYTRHPCDVYDLALIALARGA